MKTVHSLKHDWFFCRVTEASVEKSAHRELLASLWVVFLYPHHQLEIHFRVSPPKIKINFSSPNREVKGNEDLLVFQVRRVSAEPKGTRCVHATDVKHLVAACIQTQQNGGEATSISSAHHHLSLRIPHVPEKEPEHRSHFDHWSFCIPALNQCFLF